MAAKPKKNASLSRDELTKQINAFLKEGGEIEEVPSGVTGSTPVNGRRHIRITPSK